MGAQYIMVYILTNHNIMCSRGHVPHRLQTSKRIFYIGTYNMSKYLHIYIMCIK